MKGHSLTRYAWLSICAAVVTIALKYGAYLLTGSVSLLSDAMESLVNLLGAMMALAMLSIAARPADDDHPYGHGKAEYFSSGVEGALIFIAAFFIGIASIERMIHPQPLDQLGWGIIISIIASFVNLGVALILLREAKEHNSITLEADAHHLLTDVWTSGGVVLGVGAVAITGWQILDPIVAIVVALNIVWTGVRILRKSVRGLMDGAISADEQALIRKVLEAHQVGGIQYHALRTFQAGSRRFVSLHLLVPGDWTVERGHKLIDQTEAEIRALFPNPTVVLSHLESLSDPASWDDLELDGKPDKVTV